jgi:hypothetical protein
LIAKSVPIIGRQLSSTKMAPSSQSRHGTVSSQSVVEKSLQFNSVGFLLSSDAAGIFKLGLRIDPDQFCPSNFPLLISINISGLHGLVGTVGTSNELGDYGYW